MNAHATRLERAAAIFLTRTMIGFVYLFAGVHKLLDPGDLEVWRLVGAVVEVLLGALVLVGFRSRPALRCLAILIVVITVAYGVDGLLHPMGPTAMDITVVNFYILPRAALVIVTLLLPADDDLLSLDALIDGRSRRLSRTG